MTRKDNILEELKELNSSLGNQAMPWHVPTGYFEHLPGLLLARIHRIENGVEEYPLSFINGLPKEMPFTVPAGYFQTLPEQALALAKTDSLTVKEELETLSPLLSGLRKEMPYSVPQGYFDQLTENKVIEKEPAKVIPLTGRKWFRYAVAAVFIGMIISVGLFIGIGNNNAEKAIARLEKKIEKEIETAPDKELDEFLQQFSVAGLTGEEKAYAPPPNGEIDAFLDDVSVDELKEFLDETAASEATLNSETLYLN